MSMRNSRQGWPQEEDDEGFDEENFLDDSSIIDWDFGAGDNNPGLFDFSDPTQFFAATSNMPSTSRRAPAQQEAIVDLTGGSPSPPQRRSSPSRGTKRLREDDRPIPGGSSSVSTAKRKKPASQVPDEVDLVNEAPSAEEELLQAQQQETIRLQQQQGEEEPQTIGRRQCVICMENYTNVTVTTCGHLYCHECLMQALTASEDNSDSPNGTGNCPVCRKPISRRSRRGANNIIPISFMTKAGFDERKARRVQV